MTLEQLRIFIAVAERQHVTQGARDLNLTQSATSAAIAALEARYETKLFDRIGRRIVLTEAGRLFLVEAKAVLERAAAAEAVLADLAGLERGALSLAASQTVANYWLPGVVYRYRQRFPQVVVTVDIGNTETVAEHVHAGGADLGLVEGTVDDPHLAVIAIAEDDMVLVVPPGHPWTARLPDLVRDVPAGQWILRERGSGTRALFEATLLAAGVDPRRLDVVFELPSNEAVRAAVEAGAGVAVMSRLVVASALRAGTLAAVPLPLPRRQFLALRHKERYVTRAQREFLALMTADRQNP